MSRINPVIISLRIKTIQSVIRLMTQGKVKNEKEGLQEVLKISEKKKVNCGFDTAAKFIRNYNIYRKTKAMYPDEFRYVF